MRSFLALLLCSLFLASGIAQAQGNGVERGHEVPIPPPFFFDQPPLFLQQYIASAVAMNCDLRDSKGDLAQTVITGTDVRKLGEERFFSATVSLFDSAGHAIGAVKIKATVTQENGEPVGHISQADGGIPCSANLVK